MRTAIRLTVTGVLLTAAALAGTASACAAGDPAYPAPSKQQHTYSIPVGGITDLGDLTKLANLGTDFAGVLGH
ncbi:hypothetical protein [Kitasatospora sp. NBC_01266]|uniref:hypothetical protein n=1 Tax=Kitasatospora sp. NBC_01266 TaxID=2903572 RepID=UPI002E35AC80|nr:hypothetical protein [Kitasatospora sp. NBC_01266]